MKKNHRDNNTYIQSSIIGRVGTLFILIGMIPTAFGQRTTVYPSHTANHEQHAHDYYFPLTIEYDFGFETLSQEHLQVQNLYNQDSLNDFLEYSFGKNMSALDQLYLRDITEEIYWFAQKYDYNSFQLTSLILSITNTMTQHSNANYQKDVFYFPYEVMLMGAHKPLDRLSLMAGLLSAFCFDIHFVFTQDDLLVSVYTDQQQGTSFENKDYVVLNNTNLQPIVETISIQEQCFYQNTHQDPITSNIKHTLKEYSHLRNKQLALTSVHHTSGMMTANVMSEPSFKPHDSQKEHQTYTENNIVGYWIADRGGQLEAISSIYNQ